MIKSRTPPLRFNQLQFSVVREDPAIEYAVFDRFKIRTPLIIGSGGCTALSLAARYQGLRIEILEPNIHQIRLIQDKIRVIKRGQRLMSHFGVGTPDPKGKNQRSLMTLIEQGNFETLFRLFRTFLFNFVMKQEDWERALGHQMGNWWKSVFAHPYWKVSFQLFFSDHLLLPMFGPNAIQHAPTSSYPLYFRRVLERGLLKTNSQKNYFLHHIFLGHYLKSKASLPDYLVKPPQSFNFHFVHGMADRVKSFEPYDFVGLSNIFDWSHKSYISKMARRLNDELKPGAIILFRQLNNSEDFRRYFGTQVKWNTGLEKKLLKEDRSLFYQSIAIGERQ